MNQDQINEIIQREPEKSPIFYGSIRFFILTGRNKKLPFEAHKIIMKGTIKEILSSKSTKRSVIKEYFEGDKKKAYAFDLSKIELRAVDVLKFLGYGIK